MKNKNVFSLYYNTKNGDNPAYLKELLNIRKHVNSSVQDYNTKFAKNKIEDYISNLKKNEDRINERAKLVEKKRMAASLSPKRDGCLLNSFLPPSNKSDLKTLILDLDETLVHSTFDYIENYDIIIPMEIEGTVYEIYVLIRPGAIELISELSKYYEVVIFTASMNKYADPLISKIDVCNKCNFRLFREHCTYIDGTYMKDLSKLGRNLKNVVILDNCPISYSLQHNNGIPIKSWYDDKDDRDLFNLIPVLKNLSGFYDLRTEIPKFVINNTLIWTKAIGWVEENYIEIQNSLIEPNSNKELLLNIKSKETISTTRTIINNTEIINQNNSQIVCTPTIISNPNINIQIISGNFNNFVMLQENNPQIINLSKKALKKQNTEINENCNMVNKILNLNSNLKNSNNFLKKENINIIDDSSFTKRDETVILNTEERINTDVGLIVNEKLNLNSLTKGSQLKNKKEDNKSTTNILKNSFNEFKINKNIKFTPKIKENLINIYKVKTNYSSYVKPELNMYKVDNRSSNTLLSSKASGSFNNSFQNKNHSKNNRKNHIKQNSYLSYSSLYANQKINTEYSKSPETIRKTSYNEFLKNNKSLLNNNFTQQSLNSIETISNSKEKNNANSFKYSNIHKVKVCSPKSVKIDEVKKIYTRESNKNMNKKIELKDSKVSSFANSFISFKNSKNIQILNKNPLQKSCDNQNSKEYTINKRKSANISRKDDSVIINEDYLPIKTHANDESKKKLINNSGNKLTRTTNKTNITIKSTMKDFKLLNEKSIKINLPNTNKINRIDSLHLNYNNLLSNKIK